MKASLKETLRSQEVSLRIEQMKLADLMEGLSEDHPAHRRVLEACSGVIFAQDEITGALNELEEDTVVELHNRAGDLLWE